MARAHRVGDNMIYTPSIECQLMTGPAPMPGEIQRVSDLPPPKSGVFPLRARCRCGGTEGRIAVTGGNNVVRCLNCDAFQYNAPKTETGEKRRAR